MRDDSSTCRNHATLVPSTKQIKQDPEGPQGGTAGGTVLDEVREIIQLRSDIIKSQVDPHTVELGSKVEEQLRNYVKVIATLYRPNHFHNFEQ